MAWPISFARAKGGPSAALHRWLPAFSRLVQAPLAKQTAAKSVSLTETGGSDGCARKYHASSAGHHPAICGQLDGNPAGTVCRLRRSRRRLPHVLTCRSGGSVCRSRQTPAHEPWRDGRSVRKSLQGHSGASRGARAICGSSLERLASGVLCCRHCCRRGDSRPLLHFRDLMRGVFLVRMELCQ